jgi:hypothetical protein
MKGKRKERKINGTTRKTGSRHAGKTNKCTR